MVKTKKQFSELKDGCYHSFNMKRFWILFLATAAIFLILFVLASTIDFDISWGLANSKFEHSWMYGSGDKIYYYSNNGWDNFIECFGDCTCFLLPACACWSLAFSFFKKITNRQYKVYRQIAQVVIPLFLMVCAVWFVTDYNKNEDGLATLLSITGATISQPLLILSCIGISLVVNLAFAMIVWKLSERVQMSLIKLAFVFIITFIIGHLLVWAFKRPIGLTRERFRALVTDPRCWILSESSMSSLSYDLVKGSFHNWWNVTPESYKAGWNTSTDPLFTAFIDSRVGGSLNNAFDSFPSGHCADISYILLFCYLPCCVKQANDRKWKPYLIWLVLLAVIFVVVFTRISAGAHYLSDCMWGTMLSIVPIVVCSTIFCKIDKVRTWFDTCDINAQWYKFTILQVILPVAGILAFMLPPW